MTRRGPDGPTFADFPRCDDLESLDVDLAVIGVPYVSPYPGRWDTSSSETHEVRLIVALSARSGLGNQRPSALQECPD